MSAAEWTSLGCRAVAWGVLVVGLPLVAVGLRALVGLALNREGRP